MPVTNIIPGTVQNVVETHGKWYQAAYAGNIYTGTTAVGGVVIPISTTLTPTFTLWNPTGSPVNLELVCFELGWTVTTGALGTIGYSYTANTGSSISSTAPFVAFGSSIVSSGQIGRAGIPQARFAGGGTTTLVAAATWWKTSAISQLTTTAATAGPMWIAREDFDGRALLVPGTALHVMGSTAVAITATMAITWNEVPI